MPTSDIMRCLSGSDGTVWIGGDRLANLKKINVTVKGNFESLTVCGDYRTFPQYLGYSVEGSVTLAKIDSTIQKKYATAYKTGEMPDIKIISKLTDKATGKSERYMITGVVFTSFDIMNFEAQKQIDEETPIQAVDYEPLEVI